MTGTHRYRNTVAINGCGLVVERRCGIIHARMPSIASAEPSTAGRTSRRSNSSSTVTVSASWKRKRTMAQSRWCSVPPGMSALKRVAEQGPMRRMHPSRGLYARVPQIAVRPTWEFWPRVPIRVNVRGSSCSHAGRKGMTVAGQPVLSATIASMACVAEAIPPPLALRRVAARVRQFLLHCEGRVSRGRSARKICALLGHAPGGH